jgi:predicted ATPase
MARKAKVLVRRDSAPIQEEGITKITVSGYKSLLDSQSIDIKPITILAGANSSGKSSILQPLLLLKQTLDASYDPGSLLLDGPNVRFTATAQFLSKKNVADQVNSFTVGVHLGPSTYLETVFGKENDQPISIRHMTFTEHGQKLTLKPEMSDAEIRKALPKEHKKFVETVEKVEKARVSCFIRRNRCFLEVAFRLPKEKGGSLFMLGPLGRNVDKHVRRIIHIPGLRGNPERTYPVTAVGTEFPGTFERYVASVIAQWQSGDKQSHTIEELNRDLTALGLTWKVLAKRVSETQVALEVGRIQFETQRAGHDLVSIADVGFGMSQVLPVIVALHAARPTQIVFLEQPEIHLHPRAQHAMAGVIARAAKRGVRVVMETHSALTILGLQTLVASGEISSDIIALHWFTRGETGHSKIISASLDDRGAFGEWPEDFADVSLEAESKFLDASDMYRGKR